MTADWQPIATAERVEGDSLILWNGVVVVPGSAWEGGWVDTWLDWLMPQPTHWCALPDAPTPSPVTNEGAGR